MQDGSVRMIQIDGSFQIRGPEIRRPISRTRGEC